MNRRIRELYELCELCELYELRELGELYELCVPLIPRKRGRGVRETKFVNERISQLVNEFFSSID